MLRPTFCKSSERLVAVTTISWSASLPVPVAASAAAISALTGAAPSAATARVNVIVLGTTDRIVLTRILPLRRYASHVRRAIVGSAKHPDSREFDRDQSMQSDGKSMFSAASHTLLSFAYTTEVSKYNSLSEV